MRSLTAFTVCMWMSSSDNEGSPFSYAVSSEYNELLIYVASPLAPSITLRHMLFGFSSDEFLCVPRIFAYLLFVQICDLDSTQ